MLVYQNASVATKTFYGVTFHPGDIKEVPGYINDDKFIRVPAKKGESKTQYKPAEQKNKETKKPSDVTSDSKSNKEESKDGTNSDQ